MLYISLVLLSGVVSGMVSIYFRTQELQRKNILMHKQLITQLALFFIFALIFAQFFPNIEINLGFIQLGWLMIYVIFSSVSFYAVQVFYEFFSGNKLFATEQEMKKYMEELEKKRDNF